MRTQYTVAALVPALIVVLSITGFVWAQKQVTVVVDGRTLHVKTQAVDVASLLKEEGVSTAAGDVVTPQADAAISSGMTVIVRHATHVTLRLGGEEIELRVVGNTVADALSAAGADPSSNPAVTPALDAPLEDGMVISAPDVFVRVDQETAEVPFATELREDPSLPVGTRSVVASGTPGTVLRVYRVLVTGGIEGPRVLTAEHVVTAPVSEIVAVGTSRATATISNATLRFVAPKGGRRLRAETTGYASGSGGADDWTATGTLARRGVIAVDPRVIPLGTRVFIPGYGYAVAGDTGGAIHGTRIDLCFNTRAEALAWGRRTVTVIILD